MKVTSVDFVFVCRRTNFDAFKRPVPELPAKGGSSPNAVSVVEHKQYKDLLAALQKNWEAQKTTSTSPLATPAIYFRTVRTAVFCGIVGSH